MTENDNLNKEIITGSEDDSNARKVGDRGLYVRCLIKSIYTAAAIKLPSRNEAQQVTFTHLPSKWFREVNLCFKGKTETYVVDSFPESFKYLYGATDFTRPPQGGTSGRREALSIKCNEGSAYEFMTDFIIANYKFLKNHKKEITAIINSLHAYIRDVKDCEAERAEYIKNHSINSQQNGDVIPEASLERILGYAKECLDRCKGKSEVKLMMCATALSFLFIGGVFRKELGILNLDNLAEFTRPGYAVSKDLPQIKDDDMIEEEEDTSDLSLKEQVFSVTMSVFMWILVFALVIMSVFEAMKYLIAFFCRDFILASVIAEYVILFSLLALVAVICVDYFSSKRSGRPDSKRGFNIDLSFMDKDAQEARKELYRLKPHLVTHDCIGYSFVSEIGDNGKLSRVYVDYRDDDARCIRMLGVNFATPENTAISHILNQGFHYTKTVNHDVINETISDDGNVYVYQHSEGKTYCFERDDFTLALYFADDKLIEAEILKSPLVSTLVSAKVDEKQLKSIKYRFWLLNQGIRNAVISTYGLFCFLARIIFRKNKDSDK